MLSLDHQIRAALRGDDDQAFEPEVTKTASARPQHTPVDASDHEKIATALEFIGRQGVANMVKEASMHSPTNNMGMQYASHEQSTVAPHGHAPPMAPKSVGEADHDLNERPASGEGDQVHLSGDGQTHHAAFASNESAIAYDKTEKSKQVASDLSALFNAKPYADTKLKENFASASVAGDKNIHVKTASDAELLRRAIADKLAAQNREG